MFTENCTGTLGPSMRTTGAVLGGDGGVVALVSAGFTVDSWAPSHGIAVR
jgi:sensor histidine kinase regulating citrate/malate metabolism